MKKCKFLYERIHNNDYYVMFDPESGAIIKLNNSLFNVLTSIYNKRQDIYVVLDRFRVELKDFNKIKQDIMRFLEFKRSKNALETSGGIFSCLDTLKLNITGRCNLRCKYCYANYGSYNESYIKDMNKTTMINALNKLSEIYGKINKVAFFGGEPLLNFPLIRSTIDYFKERLGYIPKFSMDTNGTILVENKLLSEIEIFISIDGLKKIHDKNRKDINNDPTYEKIRNNLIYLKKSLLDFKYNIQCTVTPELNEEVNNYEEIYANLLDDFQPSSISLNPVSFSKNYHIDLVDFYKKAIDDLLNKEYNNMFIGDQSILQLIFMIIRNVRTNRICPAGSTSFTINYDGSVYPCHLLIRKDLKIFDVNIEDTKSIKEKILIFQKNFGKIFIKESSKCKKCWIRNFCSGCIPRFSYFDLERDKFCVAIKSIISYLIVKLSIAKESNQRWNKFIRKVSSRG